MTFCVMSKQYHIHKIRHFPEIRATLLSLILLTSWLHTHPCKDLINRPTCKKNQTTLLCGKPHKEIFPGDKSLHNSGVPLNSVFGLFPAQSDTGCILATEAVSSTLLKIPKKLIVLSTGLIINCRFVMSRSEDSHWPHCLIFFKKIYNIQNEH